MTPLQAIRAKCLDCMCGNRAEVKLCVCHDCPLFDFRLGKNPNIKRKELTDEQKAAMRDRALQNLRRAE